MFTYRDAKKYKGIIPVFVRILGPSNNNGHTYILLIIRHPWIILCLFGSGEVLIEQAVLICRGTPDKIIMVCIKFAYFTPNPPLSLRLFSGWL